MNKKLFWNSAFVLAAIATGIALSVKPWQVYAEQRAKADAAVEDMREAEQSRVQLTREKAKYEGSLGREELAREQGFRRPGEVAVPEIGQ
jgi:hypothetical protein